MTHRKKKRNKQQPQVSWFGEQPMKKAIPVKSSVSFLGGTTKKVNFLGIPSGPKTKVSFLGLNNKGKTIPLFRKESIKKKKKLSKWGDADLDGSPNYFDCDPVNWLKDQQSPDVQQAEASMMAGNSNDAQRLIDEATRGPTVMETLTAGAQKVGKAAKSLGRKTRRVGRTLVAPIEAGEEKARASLGKKGVKAYGAQRAYEKGIVATAKELFGAQKRLPKGREELKELLGSFEQGKKTLAEKRGSGLITDEQYSAGLNEIQLLEAPYKAQEKKISSAETGMAIYKQAIETPGLAGKYKLQKMRIDEKLARGKIPTPKEIAALAATEKKMKLFGEKGKKAVERIVPGAGTAMVVTGAALGEGGVYSKAARAKAQRVRRMTVTAMGQLFGPNILKSSPGGSFGSEPRGRGRPAGPSGEYRIGGRPVYEAEYREWEAKQGALNRMLPSQTQTQTLNPEYLEYIKQQQAKRAVAQQMAQQMEPQTPEGTGTDETGGMTQEELGMMQDEGQLPSGMSGEEAQQLLQEAYAYTRSSPAEIKEAQHMAQMQDNILKAPNINRGELKNAGGTILTPTGPQIMDAPNAFAGEMRNVTQKGERPAVVVGERPQTNPYGDEYLDIELGSGLPVVRKRPREKWMTGEAL